MRLTFEDIMALRPCWEPEDVADYFGERKYVYHTTVLRDPALPHSDRMWLAIALLPDDRARRLFACDCAERALEHVPAGEERPRQVIEVARQYAAGEATDDELAAARSAAWVARTSAVVAARDAACAAAGSAASAVRASACDASERDWQIERAIEYLEEESWIKKRCSEVCRTSCKAEQIAEWKDEI